MNLFTRDGGKTYYSLGTIAVPMGEHNVNLARRAADIDEDTRMSILGSGVVGIAFEPPLPAEQAEAFALTLARSLEIEEVRQMSVTPGAHELIETLLVRS